MRGDKIPCEHIFSNGTEFMLFMETQCWRGCTRYRNEKCRVLNAIHNAMFEEKYFPYDDLLDFEGYGGKICKHYTTEPLKKRNKPKILGKNGQIFIDEISLMREEERNADR